MKTLTVVIAGTYGDDFKRTYEALTVLIDRLERKPVILLGLEISALLGHAKSGQVDLILLSAPYSFTEKWTLSTGEGVAVLDNDDVLIEALANSGFDYTKIIQLTDDQKSEYAIWSYSKVLFQESPGLFISSAFSRYLD